MAAEHEAALDRIDAAGLEPDVVLDGRRHPLPDPSGMGWLLVVECMEDPRRFVAHWGVHGLAAGSIPIVHDTWLNVFELGDPRNARRLCYVMSRHAPAIEADFARVYPGVDPFDLWRARSWRRLVGLLDHLPTNTHLQASLASDVEHAMMVLEAQDRAERAGVKPPPSGPAMSTWSAEVDMLAKVVDAIHENTYAIGRSSGGKGSAPKPLPRPKTAFDSARFRLRQRAHDRLRRRVLPHIYGDDE